MPLLVARHAGLAAQQHLARDVAPRRERAQELGVLAGGGFELRMRSPGDRSSIARSAAQVRSVGSDEEQHRRIEGVQEPSEALDQRLLLWL